MGHLVDFVVSVLVGTISSTGYLGIVLLMALESACLPLPSEVIMPFAGYLVSTGKMSLLLASTAGAIGCNLGSTAAYYAAAFGGRPLVARWGRYVLMTTADIDRANHFFDRFGSQAVFVARLLPLVRSFIALPAGFAKMNMWRFQLYSFVGSWIWCLLLTWIGEQLGERWQSAPSIRTWFHAADLVIGVALVGGLGWWIYRHLRANQR